MILRDAETGRYTCAQCGTELGDGVGPFIRDLEVQIPLQQLWAAFEGGFRPTCTVCIMLLALEKITAKDL